MRLLIAILFTCCASAADLRPISWTYRLDPLEARRIPVSKSVPTGHIRLMVTEGPDDAMAAMILEADGLRLKNMSDHQITVKVIMMVPRRTHRWDHI